jgi:hypothetical protein
METKEKSYCKLLLAPEQLQWWTLQKLPLLLLVCQHLLYMLAEVFSRACCVDEGVQQQLVCSGASVNLFVEEQYMNHCTPSSVTAALRELYMGPNCMSQLAQCPAAMLSLRVYTSSNVLDATGMVTAVIRVALAVCATTLALSNDTAVISAPH